MRLGKAIPCKPFNLFKQVMCKGAFITAICHASNQLFFEFKNAAVFFPTGHGTAQLISFTPTKTCSDHGKLNNLLLKYGNAHSARKHAFYRFRWVGDHFIAMTPNKIRMHHITLNRSRTNNGDLHHQIIVTSRF